MRVRAPNSNFRKIEASGKAHQTTLAIGMALSLGVSILSLIRFISFDTKFPGASLLDAGLSFVSGNPKFGGLLNTHHRNAHVPRE